MSHIFDSIERGETPAFSGASGNLYFSTEHYTTVMYYDNRSENHSSSAYAAWEWNKQFSQHFEKTCCSGSVAERCVGIPGLLMITAANGYEISKADRFSNELGIWMTNRFTSVLLDHLDERPGIPLRDLYTSLFRQTLGSHVSVYNVNNYGSVYRNNMSEFMVLK